MDYDEQYIRKNDRFPSDENSDYCQLSLHFTIDNRSLLSQNNITGIILCEDENSPIIIKRENAFNGEIDPMTKKTIMCMLFLIYKGNMSDEELISYMKEQTVVLSYQSDLKIGTIKLKLSDFDLNQYDGDDSEK